MRVGCWGCGSEIEIVGQGGHPSRPISPEFPQESGQGRPGAWGSHITSWDGPKLGISALNKAEGHSLAAPKAALPGRETVLSLIVWCNALGLFLCPPRFWCLCLSHVPGDERALQM